MKDLIIVGAGGFGRETKVLVDEINEAEPTWNFLGYVDDNPNVETKEGDKILGTSDYVLGLDPKPYVIIPIANARVRMALAEKMEKGGVPFATLIHPNVKMKGNLCTVGEGSILCDGVKLAVNSHVGRHCILNMDCGLGHDTVMDDFSSMMSQTITGGETYIGKGCYFGLRCTVINLLKITDFCTFGAGAVVVKNATEPGTYVGVPARLIKPLA